MAATRGHQTRMESKEELSYESDVYELPVPARCRTTATPFCRFVPFMPCYNDLDVTGRLRQTLSRICCRRQPASDCV